MIQARTDGVPAVHNHRLAGDEVGGDEREDGIGDVLGLADLPQHGMLGLGFLRELEIFAQAFPQPLTVNEARSDGVDSNARAERAGQREREIDDRCLRRAVGNAAARTDDARDAGDIDDDAVAVALQMRTCGAGRFSCT